MLPLDALKSMRVMIATPCYGASLTASYVASAFALANQCGKNGLDVRLNFVLSKPVSEARNHLAMSFLADPNFTHLFFIDDDVGFTIEGFIRALLADRDVVAGLYPLKRILWPKNGVPEGFSQKDFEAHYNSYPFVPLPGKGLEVDVDRFAEVAEAPTGFMCIKRGVFEAMKAGYPDLQYMTDQNGEYWGFFDTMMDPVTRRFLSEDFAFCRRWRDLGGKVFVDINSKLTHTGQHTWNGDFLARLEATAKPR